MCLCHQSEQYNYNNTNNNNKEEEGKATDLGCDRRVSVS